MGPEGSQEGNTYDYIPEHVERITTTKPLKQLQESDETLKVCLHSSLNAKLATTHDLEGLMVQNIIPLFSFSQAISH